MYRKSIAAGNIIEGTIRGSVDLDIYCAINDGEDLLVVVTY